MWFDDIGTILFGATTQCILVRSPTSSKELLIPKLSQLVSTDYMSRSRLSQWPRRGWHLKILDRAFTCRRAKRSQIWIWASFFSSNFWLCEPCRRFVWYSEDSNAIDSTIHAVRRMTHFFEFSNETLVFRCAQRYKPCINREFRYRATYFNKWSTESKGSTEKIFAPLKIFTFEDV